MPNAYDLSEKGTTTIFNNFTGVLRTNVAAMNGVSMIKAHGNFPGPAELMTSFLFGKLPLHVTAQKNKMHLLLFKGNLIDGFQ